MNDELIALAKEAGMVTAHNTEHLTIAGIERFANLVAAKEREECAKVCETHAPKGLQHGLSYAAAIRARKT